MCMLRRVMTIIQECTARSIDSGVGHFVIGKEGTNMMQPGDKVSTMEKDKISEKGKGNVVEEPLVVDGFPVKDSMLPHLDELSPELQDMARMIGVRQVLRLSLQFSGCHVYFPSFKQFRVKLRHARIRAEYDAGVSAKRLAQMYKLSERQVWNILGT